MGACGKSSINSVSGVVGRTRGIPQPRSAEHVSSGSGYTSRYERLRVAFPPVVAFAAMTGCRKIGERPVRDRRAECHCAARPPAGSGR